VTAEANADGIILTVAIVKEYNVRTLIQAKGRSVLRQMII